MRDTPILELLGIPQLRLPGGAAVDLRQKAFALAALLHIEYRGRARRQAVATRMLSSHSWHAERFAYHGWLQLPNGWTTAEFVAQARRARVAVTPGDAFAVSGRCEPPAIRLSLTATADRDSLEDALDRVVRLLELGPRASISVL